MGSRVTRFTGFLPANFQPPMPFRSRLRSGTGQTDGRTDRRRRPSTLIADQSTWAIAHEISPTGLIRLIAYTLTLIFLAAVPLARVIAVTSCWKICTFSGQLEFACAAVTVADRVCAKRFWRARRRAVFVRCASAGSVAEGGVDVT